MTYLVFNSTLGTLVFLACYCLTPGKAKLSIAFRAAGIVTLISYPWVFFAIHFKAWTYNEPGPAIFAVPINDLIFIFLCTVFSVSLFLRLDRSKRAQTKGKPNAKHSADYGPEG